MRTRVHDHDCDKCVWLGSVLADGKEVDLYVCRRSRTVLARYSSEPGDYTSLPLKMATLTYSGDACLVVAAMRAKAKGGAK